MKNWKTVLWVANCAALFCVVGMHVRLNERLIRQNREVLEQNEELLAEVKRLKVELAEERIRRESAQSRLWQTMEPFEVDLRPPEWRDR